jgi:hypothetical protein
MSPTFFELTQLRIKAGTSHMGTGTNFSGKETGRYRALE